MKQIFNLSLGALMAMSVLPAAASITDTGKVWAEDTPEIMTSQFLIDKNPQLLFTEEDGDIYTFTILDSKFNEVAKFSTPQYQEVEGAYTYWRAVEGPQDVYVQNSNEWPMWDGSEEEFAQMCMGEGYTRQEKTDSETRYLSEEPGRYFFYEAYEYKYPQQYRVWRDGMGYEVNVYYGYNGWGPLGWGSAQEGSDSCTPQPVMMYAESESCGDMNDILLTQTLFNTDAAYEWIIPIYEAKNVAYENKYEKVEGNKVVGTGFKVVSQNGSTVATVNFPAEYSFNYELDLDLYILGTDIYLMCSVQDSKGDNYKLIYAVSSENSSVKQVGAARRVSVSPTSPRRGTPVNVTLPTESMNVTSVKVVSASGAVVMSRNIEPNVTSTSIDTRNFAPGLYIVNVTDGKSIREAAKIIVR